MSTKCQFCGNRNFKEVLVSYTYKHKGKYLLVNDVPCKQCEYCGEQYFRADVLKSIEKEFNEIYLHGKKANRVIKVPVEQYASIYG